ncbi:creatininase family protein, partial [Roseomonas mucosa]|uniref:creatininase family protein n=1 Tax=Roseomonas mucosa TaxID=207340 RepID=UPI00384C6426
MYWEDLTWPELDRTSRTTPVVLNLASIEQHGPHLPLSTDSAIGGFFMQKLDEALGSSVLVLPQVKVCCSAHHMVPLQSSQQVANGRGRFRIRRRPGTTRPHSWL